MASGVREGEQSDEMNFPTGREGERKKGQWARSSSVLVLGWGEQGCSQALLHP